ncbi:cellobiose phosphorylase [Paenibacillus sp. 598K]|uniref:GH36-type glycosyl hydrolase domain-containing protein n=1 Tax=Paenibacillus sp. 598K TaxID=1117987 RepID=UPI000FFA71F8|nr:cellobiose phosphorylase [Paenibacillus sp. 598K]GBF75240.1 cellobiose phosphorylase [Paenibacillus sp. 598K]
MTAIATSYSEAGYRLQAGPLRFIFHPAGDLYEATGDGFMLNQLLTHPYDGSLNQLYLRLRQERGYEVYPLLGVRSDSRIDRLGNRLRWRGQAGEIGYEVVFSLSARGAWFWEIALEAAAGAPSPDVDLFYGQDLGLASPGAVRSNEAYNAQYIDHSAHRDERKGWVVCSRQNQPQAGRFPYLQQGCLDGAVAYATDGFQFFGLSYKESGEPEALRRELLPSQVYQYENAYTSLQAKPLFTDGRARTVFYGLFRADPPEAVTEAAFGDTVEAAWREIQDEPRPSGEGAPMPQRAEDLGDPVSARSLTTAELDRLYPERIEEEWRDGRLLSFFLPDGEHIVLKDKELRTERPHGHILLSGVPERVGETPLASTAYMYGVFHSQLVLGNTSFNKLISHTRSALNAARLSGLRLYAELDGRFHMLAMPSLFEIGYNYARWIYALADDTLVITSYTSADTPLAGLRVESQSGTARRYLATAQITMREREYEGSYVLEPCDGGWRVAAAADAPSAAAYPGLSFRIGAHGTTLRAADDRRLMPDLPPQEMPLLVLETDASADWSLIIEGRLDGGDLCQPLPQPDWQQEKAAYRAALERLMNGFRLQHPGDDPAVRRLDLLARWYTHNMLIHFASPHGLEQYGGAAWGTRDVCQGPAEYFLAMQRTDTVRDILATVYSHQYEHSGTWPQWFMFDQYSEIQQHESHGDIIVWPLKLLGDYLAATGDESVLDLELPYTDEDSFAFTEQRYPLRAHVERQLDYIRRHCRPGTSLSSYGDGDWDDTLQPARPELRADMVSSWTVALTYQSTERLGRLLSASAAPETVALGAELAAMATAIRSDFHRYMDPDRIIPGFLYMEDGEEPVKWLHPSDERTGIRYRLLPMTRSMIAGLITPEQAAAHYSLIHEELSYPDGVRLMDRPAAYEGGVSHRFKRAEQAANFGREIGLQYVHAHIRYIEAMAKLGKPQDAWQGLQVINPIGLADVVPGAELRQSNAYFSSSDGNFATRAEAAEQFAKLRTGEASVKGGWRIYSSGPGIYMQQLVCQVLGVRVTGRRVELDPVLPQQLDGLTFRFAIAGIPVLLRYRLSGDNQPIARIAAGDRELALTRLPGPYRATGVSLDLDQLQALAPANGDPLTLTIEA